LRKLQQARHASVLSMEFFALEQQRKSFLKREPLRGAVCHLLG
jgi:hypothetical protein